MHGPTKTTCLSWALCLVAAWSSNAITHAAVRLPSVFSEHMVLQRETTVPVWGTAAAGEEITVAFRDQQQTATADANGRWRVKLTALKAGGPDTLSISGTNTIVFQDVLVGEVWVGSGQSNMAGNAAGYASRNDRELAKVLEAAPYANLRLLRSPGNWTTATQQTCGAFSALLLAFGHRLHEKLDIPVGLIVGAVGGTPSGMWLSQQAFQSDAACQRIVAEAKKSYDEEAADRAYRAAITKWEQAVERAKAAGSKEPRKPQPPARPGEMAGGQIGGLYQRYIHPIVGYGIRGVLWDQGESGTRIAGVDQHTLMGALIHSWRKTWGQGDFPFLYVQKPSGGGCAWDPSDPVTRNAEDFAQLPASKTDGRYRELHIRIRGYPRTYMVTASDLGPGVHPTNKWGYGARAARVALGAAYGRDVAIYGPTYLSHEIADGQIRIQFENVGQGLAFQPAERPQGFAVAGKDRVFHWAHARIDGDAIVVSADAVAQPVAVRYAWSRSHPWANLFNRDGLPATCFRTDDW